ncbi:unnamed protein product [Rotaria sp. Silwood1]|nr:unnamed protein product [Rotaria sp. Silwood1]
MYNRATLVGWDKWCSSSCNGGTEGTVVSSSCRTTGNCYRSECRGGGGRDYLLQKFLAVVGQSYTISFWFQRASIEQVGESSSMQLKTAFQKYESLRSVYDSKIIEMSMQCGFYMTPEQWSLLLYGYTTNESIIDPIIDKLLTKTSFQTAIQQYKKIVLLSGAVHGQDLDDLMQHFQFLSNDNLAINASGSSVLTSTLHMLKRVVNILNKLKK